MDRSELSEAIIHDLSALFAAGVRAGAGGAAALPGVWGPATAGRAGAGAPPARADGQLRGDAQQAKIVARDSCDRLVFALCFNGAESETRDGVTDARAHERRAPQARC
jgi:hypothetical protein